MNKYLRIESPETNHSVIIVDTDIAEEDYEALINMGITESLDSDLIYDNLFIEAVTSGLTTGFLKFEITMAYPVYDINHAPFFQSSLPIVQVERTGDDDLVSLTELPAIIDAEGDEFEVIFSDVPSFVNYFTNGQNYMLQINIVEI